VLTKMILKLLFKAMVPLICVAGFLSYGLYMKGGDPMAMWSKIGGGMLGSLRDTGTKTAESVQSLSPVGGGQQKSRFQPTRWRNRSVFIH